MLPSSHRSVLALLMRSVFLVPFNVFSCDVRTQHLPPPGGLVGSGMTRYYLL